MTACTSTREDRLLVVGDLDRLGPLIRECFAPNPISGVRGLLAGIAEIPRAPTRAVLVGHDPACRNVEAAVSAMRRVAGADMPVVYCCEPGYEHIGRRVIEHGADDYVIFPPESADLERALRMPSGRTQRRWLELPVVVPAPTAEELARLADLLSRMSGGDPKVTDAMATLVCVALDAEHAAVMIDERIGRAGKPGSDADEAVLSEAITQGEQRLGAIRVGRCRTGGYTHEHTAKLRHYGVLFGRLIDSTRRSEDWRRLALTDDLTRLPNRRHLMRFLEKRIRWAQGNKATLSVLYFDIDDFKGYNDRYGHDAGDEILVDVGQMFIQCSRKHDMVARYGGDEFVVVFWDPKGPREAGSQHPQSVIEVLQRFRANLKSHRFARLGPEAQGCLTISGGLAQYPWQANTAPELLAAADQALLQAKEAGKDRFRIIGSGDVAGEDAGC